MKYLLTLFIMLTVSVMNLSAEVSREGNNFRVESTSTAKDTQTKYTWEDKEGNKYPIYITKKGACYILRISKKTNKEYKYYLPKEVQEQIKQELNIN